MIDFWLIRHGETEENAKGICQGQTPGTLSERGYMQAKAVSEVLKDESFDTFYSSDLLRTMKSMEAVIQFHPGQQIIPEPLLRERYLAAWQGNPFPKDWDEHVLPEGAETADDLVRRAKEFIALLKQKHEGEKVVAMSHGGLIRGFWTVLNHLDTSAYYEWESPKNTSISRFQLFEDGSVTMILMNEAEHLKVPVLKSNNKSEW